MADIKQEYLIDEQAQHDIEMIVEAIREIREGSGYGRVLIEIHGGQITELEVTQKIRPKLLNPKKGKIEKE